MALTWGLVVATKDRIEPLCTCIEHALAQSPQPFEIIIVDASVDWARHQSRVTDMLKPYPQIRLLYEQASRPSSAVQRNQGIAQAQADILFLIDDDSFLYPNAVAEVLDLYALDTAHSVPGIQLTPAAQPPDKSAMPAAKQNTEYGMDNVANTPGLKRRLLRALLSYGPQGNFIPYDGVYPDRPVPTTLSSSAVRQTRLFEGFRMTLRREVAQRLMFDPSLLYYSPGEDLDISFRASQDGPLLTAKNALVHHFNSGDGRLKRAQVETLGTLNQALFLRKNAKNLPTARMRYIGRILHRAFAGALMDLWRKRFTLPKARGTLKGLVLSAQVFDTPLDRLEPVYADLQHRVVKG